MEPRAVDEDDHRSKNHEGLNDREKDCVIATEMGYTVDEIGNWLGLSPATVRGYMGSARDKFRVSKTEIVYFRAREIYGLISDQDIARVIARLRQAGFPVFPI